MLGCLLWGGAFSNPGGSEDPQKRLRLGGVVGSSGDLGEFRDEGLGCRVSGLGFGA